MTARRPPVGRPPNAISRRRESLVSRWNPFAMHACINHIGHSLTRYSFTQTAVRTLSIVKPTRDLRTRLMAASEGMTDTESRELNHFIDLLEHCLALNPEKRIKPSDALKHPFFTARAHAAAKR